MFVVLVLIPVQVKAAHFSNAKQVFDFTLDILHTCGDVIIVRV